MSILLSTLIGVIIAVMILINGTLSGFTGNYTSSVIIHAVGLISIVLVLITSKSKLNIQKGIPLYMYSAGVVGIFTVFFNNLSFSALGVSMTLALGLLGQSLSSIIIDHFGLLGMKVVKFEKKKLIGLIFIIAGICVMAVF